MKKFAKLNYQFLLLILISLLSSCSSNVFTSRKFHLDLVKVEKKQIEKPLPKQVIIIPEKSIEVISTSNENQFILSLSGEQTLKENLDLKLNRDLKHSFGTKTYTKKLTSFFDSIYVKKVKDEPIDRKHVVRWDVVSILSVVVGIIAASLLFTTAFGELILLWMVLSLLAFVLGAIGLSRTGKSKRRGKGFAITGFVLGFAQVILLLLLIVFLFLFLFSSY